MVMGIERRLQGFGVIVVLIAALALGLLLPSTAQATSGDCGTRISGPAKLTGVFFADGSGARGDRPLLVGRSLVLENGLALEEGREILLSEPLQSGVLYNAGDRPLALVFSNGEMAVLQPGESLAVGNAKCECRCTCKTATGDTHAATFPCSSNSDTCKYDGDICQWSEGGVTHTGTYTGCIKVWVISDTTQQ